MYRILFICSFVSLLSTGCGYRLGNPTPPGVTSVHVGKVKNHTDEPRLAVIAANKIRGAIAGDGSLRLDDTGNADSDLSVTVTEYVLGTAGSAKLISKDKEQQIYSTSIYRVSVTLEYDFRPGSGAADSTKYKGKVIGVAEFSDLIDINVAKRDGLRQALADAGKKLVTDVVNVW